MGTKIFDLVTLTLTFDLLLKNFNLGHSFLTRRGKASILHMKFDLLYKKLTRTMTFVSEAI